MKKMLLTFILLSACNGQHQSTAQYYTWDGLEPDRWSSIWFIKRHVNPSVEVSILPVGALLKGSIAIATPKSEITRTHGFSNFENMLKAYDKNNDVGLMRLGQFINELEISPWRSATPAVAIVEQQFRTLQLKYNRVDVPYECYAGFFDILYDVLKNSEVKESEDYLDSLYKKLEPDNVCQISAEAIAIESMSPVQEYPVGYVLKMISANKTVIFVDTREDKEFDEHHIPGAINLKLRDVGSASAKQFEDADLVISYCIKDFRGYEVALALSKVGVKNIGIMKPYGLKGWKDLNLPVADSNATDDAAMKVLRKRAAQGV